MCPKLECAATVSIYSAAMYAEASMRCHLGVALSTATLRFERRVNGYIRYHIIDSQASTATKLYERSFQPGVHKFSKNVGFTSKF
jgi:hypothetical protein